MPLVPWSRPKPYLFDDLPSLTRGEVDLWSWYSRLSPGPAEWNSWLADIFGHLLERPSGQRFRLVQTHLVDTQFGEKVLAFGSKLEVFIGRASENDIVLPANAVAHRNTRIALRDGRVYLEDLGGKLGTYLWDKKVRNGEPHAIKDGDQFTVFPYLFRVLLENYWSPETEFAVTDCKIESAKRAEYSQASPVGWRTYRVDAHPSREQALVQVSSAFLVGIQRRILGPLGLDKVSGPVPSDDALTEFVLLASLERLNRRLKFPVQFSLEHAKRNTSSDDNRGMLLSFALGVGDLTGNFRIFIPSQLLLRCRPDSGTAATTSYPAGLSWGLPVSAGFVDLSAVEIAQVGLGDILVAQREPAMFFPNDFRTGWTLHEEGSNSMRFKVDKYFERGVSVDAGGEVTASVNRPDIEALPLRLHVILGEKEFTLAEIQSLSPGAIVDLEGTKLDPVRLMVNGKVLGDGELVEVEGKLAVRVLRWRNTG